MEIEDETLKKAIKHKSLKSGTKIDDHQYLVRYNKVLYLVDFKNDAVIVQSEHK